MDEIELKPSRWLGLLLIALTGLVLGALWTAALPPGLAAAASVLVPGLAAWGARRARPTLRLRLKADGRLQGRTGEIDWCDLDVLDDSFVSTLLIVLRYRIEGSRPRALTLLPDSAAAEDLRRLRVSLRWGRRTRSDTSSQGAG